VYGAVLLGLSVACSPAPVDTGPAILASWSDGHRLVRYPEEVRAEVRAILEGAGIRVRWSDELGESGSDRFLPVSVVVIPSEPSGAGWHISPSAMGVYLAEEEASAVFIFYHRVARVVGVSSGRNGMMDPSDAKRLARALGRVAVHELVHRVAPELPHADSGLMRDDLGRSLLTRRKLELDDRSRSAVLAVLRGVKTANHLSPGPRTK
jgi:hypothetical protein